VSSNLVRRVQEDKQKLIDGFTKRYNVTWLAYYEKTSDVRSTTAREKEIKGWRRSKKEALIESMNPRWKDLAMDWYDPQGESLKPFARSGLRVTIWGNAMRCSATFAEVSGAGPRFDGRCNSERSEESKN